MLEKHFVTFFSPGTIVHEQTTMPIKSWDVEAATGMAREITERHGATPFAFEFSTRRREDSDLDSRVVATSTRYFFGGNILTLEEIQARDNPNDHILIDNMKCNGWARVLESCKSWRSVHPLEADDIVLEFGVVKEEETP